MTTVYKNMKSLSFDNGATVYRLQDATAQTSIGDLSDLTTSVKTDLVSAVNSLNVDTSYTAKCPAITPSSGIATWVVTHNLGSEAIISTLYDKDGAEIMKNTTVDSANQITVTFNATNSISAEDYSIVVLADGGTSGGGGGSTITIDTTLSTTSTNPVQNKVITTALNSKLDTASYVVDSTISSTSTNPLQNKVIYPILANYIPRNTTFTVKGDGTGDFIYFSQALNYLKDKWSDGQIYVSVDNGTFTETNNVTINLQSCGIPLIRIQGKGTSNTTVRFTEATEHSIKLHIFNSTNMMVFSGINFIHSTGSKTTDYRGLVTDIGTLIYVQDCSFNGLNYAVYATGSGRIHLAGTNTFSNCNNAISASSGGCIGGNWATTINMSNVNYAFWVEGGGNISLAYPNYTGTGVANKCNQTPNTLTVNGVITGFAS